jgi:hypothetical protein
MMQRMTKQQILRYQNMSTNRDTLTITNTLKAILIVAVVAVLLGAVVPHTQSAFAQIMKFKQHPDNPTIGNVQPYTPPQISNNPLGLMVPGLG